MGQTMESIVASWPGLILLGILSALELVSKCVPVIDEVVDSIVVWIVPFMSILGTLSTMGLVSMDAAAGEGGDEDGGRRQLGVSSGAILFLQIILIIFGMCLALSMHLTKMFVRMIGVGWLTSILTVVEVSWTISTVTMAIFIQQIAIFLAAIMIGAAAVVVKRKLWDKRHNGDDDIDSQLGGERQRMQADTTAGGGYYATDEKGFAVPTPAV